jgi:hypothetical protein
LKVNVSRAKEIFSAGTPAPANRSNSESLHERFAAFAHGRGDAREVALFPECFVWIHTEDEGVRWLVCLQMLSSPTPLSDNAQIDELFPGKAPSGEAHLPKCRTTFRSGFR